MRAEIVTLDQLPPFFILSCQRSGSSLLSRMLDAHPQLAVPYESRLFTSFYPWLKYYGDLAIFRNRERLIDDILSTDEMHDWFPPVDRNHVLSSIRVHNFGGVVEAIMRSWAESQNKPRWGEKTPGHLFYWREIFQYFPQALVIHIVRDGRDVALSCIRARFGPKTIYSAAVHWVACLQEMNSLRASISPKAFYEVRYEDLLEDPQRVLSEICNFLGEAFTPEMFEFYKITAPYRTDLTNMENLSRPLLRNNTQKWKLQMSADDLRVFEAIAQGTLREYGYEPALKNPTISKTEALYRRLVENPPRKLVAMAKNRKSQKAAVIRFKLLARLILIDRSNLK